jgi:hypothetical protein
MARWAAPGAGGAEVKLPKLGPTGDFPHGKLFGDDQGGINVALRRFTAPDGRRMVRIDFGKPVDWLALPREQALAFAAVIAHFAGEEDDAEDLGRRGPSDPEGESERQ